MKTLRNIGVKWRKPPSKLLHYNPPSITAVFIGEMEINGIKKLFFEIYTKLRGTHILIL
jgi:hypothetical protein